MQDPSTALTEALHIGIRSQQVSFDWEHIGQVIDKVEEEWAELKEAIASGESKAMEDELGDVFFTLVQLSRHLQLDPEHALTSANHKFLRRFGAMKKIIEEANLNLSELSLETMETYWKKAKKLERQD